MEDPARHDEADRRRRAEEMTGELLGIAGEAMEECALFDAARALRAAIDLAGREDVGVRAAAKRFRSIRRREGRKRRKALGVAGFSATAVILAVTLLMLAALPRSSGHTGGAVAGMTGVSAAGAVMALLKRFVPALRRPNPARLRLSRKRECSWRERWGRDDA